DKETKRRRLAVTVQEVEAADPEVVEQKRTARIVPPTKPLHPAPPLPEEDAPREEATSLDGFQFLDCLGRSPLGEMWTVETPQRGRRLVKLINTFSKGQDETTVAAQLRAIRHRGLLPARVIPHTANRLAVVTAVGRDSLGRRLQECQASGQVGVPRLELLGHLLNAARTLDELQTLYSVQHLGLNPRGLMLVDGRVQIADFGLMALVWLPAKLEVAQINPRYSAPELFARRLSRACDQYSLALIYYELLTGDQVHGSRTPSQLARVRNLALDCLDLLPAPDRPILARVLDPEPANRFPS